MIGDVRVCLIWAMARNRVIGKGNTLPWRLRTDMLHFKRTTMGKPVIMGRKNFQSFGVPLPGRTNILLTRDTAFAAAGVTVVHTLDDALEVACAQCFIDGQNELMVIGGADIYALTLPIADRLYLTEIQADIEGDTWFPEFDRADWREVSRVEHPAGERDSYPCSFVVLDRCTTLSPGPQKMQE